MVGVVRGVIQPILEIDDNEDRSMGCHNTLFPSTPDRVLLESLNMWQSSSQPIGWLEWELYGLVLLQFEWVICHKFYFCTSGSHLLRTFFWAVTCCLPDLVISQVCCCFIHSVWLIINSRFFWLTSKIRIFYTLSFYMDNPIIHLMVKKIGLLDIIGLLSWMIRCIMMYLRMYRCLNLMG